jgi:hypothetical protein
MKNEYPKLHSDHNITRNVINLDEEDSSDEDDDDTTLTEKTNAPMSELQRMRIQKEILEKRVMFQTVFNSKTMDHNVKDRQTRIENSRNANQIKNKSNDFNVNDKDTTRVFQ